MYVKQQEVGGSEPIGAESAGEQKAATRTRRERTVTQSFMVLRGEVGESNRKQWEGRCRDYPTPAWKGQRKARVRVRTPVLDWLKSLVSSCSSGWRAWARAGSFLLPLMGLGRVRARELKSEDHWIFSGPRIYPMEHPALDPASASALETAGNMPHWG